jgi:hypothetical protein
MIRTIPESFAVHLFHHSKRSPFTFNLALWKEGVLRDLCADK